MTLPQRILPSMLILLLGGAVYWVTRGVDSETAAHRSATLDATPSDESQARAQAARRIEDCRRQLVAGDLAAARELLERLTVPAEQRVPALLLAAEIEHADGRFFEAERVLLAALEEAPENPDVHRWLAAVYYDLGSTDRTVAHLEETARRDADDGRSLIMLGRIYTDFERFTDAATAYERALERPIESALRQEAIIGLAAMHLHLQRDADALEVLRQADATPEANVLRAEALWNVGQTDRSVALLDTLEGAGESTARCRLLRARMAMESGRTAEAVRVLESFVRDDPHHVDGRYRLAMAYRAAGRVEDSRRELSEVERLKDLKTKLTELTRRAEQHPRDPAVREAMADVCRELGMPEMVQVWNRAAEVCRVALSTAETTPPTSATEEP